MSGVYRDDLLRLRSLWQLSSPLGSLSFSLWFLRRFGLLSGGTIVVFVFWPLSTPLLILASWKRTSSGAVTKLRLEILHGLIEFLNCLDYGLELDFMLTSLFLPLLLLLWLFLLMKLVSQEFYFFLHFSLLEFKALSYLLELSFYGWRVSSSLIRFSIVILRRAVSQLKSVPWFWGVFLHLRTHHGIIVWTWFRLLLGLLLKIELGDHLLSPGVPSSNSLREVLFYVSLLIWNSSSISCVA